MFFVLKPLLLFELFAFLLHLSIEFNRAVFFRSFSPCGFALCCLGVLEFVTVFVRFRASVMNVAHLMPQSIFNFTLIFADGCIDSDSRLW